MIVVWRITQRCNLSCPFCSYDRTLSLPRIETNLETVLRFGAVLAKFQRDTGDPVLVSWIGGEPFLWRHLREATTLLTREFGLRVSATTNGTTLNSPEVREHIVEHFSELTVSVDAPGPLHSALRGWAGGFDALQRSVPALAQLKRERGRGPLLRVNTVLMRDNVGAFEELCACVAAWGVNEISFNQLGGRDRPEFFPAHRLRPSDVTTLAESLPRLREELAESGIRLVGANGYLDRMRATAADEYRPVFDCRPGERFLFVDEYGRAAPCNYTAEQIGVPIGMLGSVDAVKALPGRLAEALERCRPGACADCHSTQVWEKFAR